MPAGLFAADPSRPLGRAQEKQRQAQGRSSSVYLHPSPSTQPAPLALTDCFFLRIIFRRRFSPYFTFERVAPRSVSPPFPPPLLFDAPCSVVCFRMKQQAREMEGKLSCPNKACGARLGSLKWTGAQCSCKRTAGGEEGMHCRVGKREGTSSYKHIHRRVVIYFFSAASKTVVLMREEHAGRADQRGDVAEIFNLFCCLQSVRGPLRNEMRRGREGQRGVQHQPRQIRKKIKENSA